MSVAIRIYQNLITAVLCAIMHTIIICQMINNYSHPNEITCQRYFKRTCLDLKMAVVSVNKKKRWGVKQTSYVSSQMCGRTTEIAAVGAWVQPGPGIQNEHDDVVVRYSCT